MECHSELQEADGGAVDICLSQKVSHLEPTPPRALHPVLPTDFVYPGFGGEN